MGLKQYARSIMGAFKNNALALDYPWYPKSRANSAKPIYDVFLPILVQPTDGYLAFIQEISTHVDRYLQIPAIKSDGVDGIYWKNGFLPGLDIVSIYALIAHLNPKKIIEIGSGNSTAVMRKAIVDHDLQSHITCIDPSPRRDITGLADHCIKESLEALSDHSMFFNLSPGDVVFFDGSHIALPNSDVTVFFMEILPYIPAGVYVQVHDIYLPYDYPEDMVLRGYNEQYMLAQALMYHQAKFEIIWPSFWISKQLELQSLLEKNVWDKLKYKDIETHGCSFWFKVIR
jgi:hypothetical protein